MRKKLFTRERLRGLAGAQSFERGEKYAFDGAVADIAEDGGRVHGRVLGTEMYEVGLWMEGDEMGWSCSCPVGSDGDFCKHAVALALVWTGEVTPSEGKAPTHDSMEDLREYLESKSPKYLVEIIVGVAVWDPALRDRLMLRMQIEDQGGEFDERSIRKLLDRAIKRSRFVSYEEARAYSDQVGEAIDMLEDLLEAGQVNPLVELCEHGIGLLEKMISTSMDDSDGYAGENIARLMDLHLRVCQAARPEPKALAKRLFSMAEKSGFGFFATAAQDYGKVLGEVGLKTYEQLLDKAEARLPPHDRKDNYDKTSYKRRDLWMRRESLLRSRGDWDGLIALASRDLSSPWEYMKLANVSLEAGREEEAVAWLEKGEAAHREHRDDRLIDMLVELYLKRNAVAKAKDLAWERCRVEPSGTAFSRLKMVAEKAGNWTGTKKEALDFLRAEVRKRSSKKTRNIWEHCDASLLVEILLREGDVEDAWTAAKESGCRVVQSRHGFIEVSAC